MVDLKRIMIVSLLIALFPLSTAHAALIEHALSFKVSILMNHTDYEWSYTNPEEYRYIKGNHIIKNKAAKPKVEKLFALLNISEKADVDDMVKALKAHGYKNIQAVDIRFVNQENQLYTWVWHKKN